MDPLEGVADSIVGEVFNSLSGSNAEGLDLNTIVPLLQIKPVALV